MKQTAPKYIYLVFSATQNGMGRMIRRVTGYEFNHVSVSLCPAPGRLYSFARHYKDTPLYGGFVCESAQRYAATRGRAARVHVCAVPVNAAQYRRAKQYIDRVKRERKSYIYNMVSAVTFPLGIDVRIERAMTCIQFATAVLRCAAAPRSSLIPSFCTIRALETLYSDCTVYDGPFPAAGCPGQEDYLRRNSLGYRITRTTANMGRLLRRMIVRRA